MRNQNIDCINSKFYLFNITIKRTHILVGMQYTLNNLYTNGTLNILNGSLEIWFTNNTRIQLNMVEQTMVQSWTNNWTVCQLNHCLSVEQTMVGIVWSPSLTHFSCNISVFDHPWNHLSHPLNNWPRLLARSASAVMAVRQRRNKYDWSCAQQSQIKKDATNNLWPKERICCTTLKRLLKHEKNRATASTCAGTPWCHTSSFHQLRLLQRKMPHSTHFD